jgi:hypothetical protein
MQKEHNMTVSKNNSNRRILMLIAGFSAVCVLLGFGAWRAMQAGMMSDIPTDLDYSTSRLTEKGLYRVSYQAEAELIPVNRMHTWILRVETSDGRPVENASIQVDGDMPQHGHGLPSRPQVTQNLGSGDYLVEGVKFQMGGWWVMDFSITADGQSDSVRFNMQLQ